jgi:hypothetical protein
MMQLKMRKRVMRSLTELVGRVRGEENPSQPNPSNRGTARRFWTRRLTPANPTLTGDAWGCWCSEWDSQLFGSQRDLFPPLPPPRPHASARSPTAVLVKKISNSS